MQLRPILPTLIANAGTDILPVDLDANRGTITRVRLFLNNSDPLNDADATITVAGAVPFVVKVANATTVLVLDDVPVQQPDATSGDVQIRISGGGGEIGEADTLVAFGSFVVT